MKILIPTIVVVLLSSLFSSGGAITLVLSNEENSSRIACVTCYEMLDTRIAACTVPGNETSILLPKSPTSDPESTRVLCVAKYNDEVQDNKEEKPYFAYYSEKDYDKYKHNFFIKANDTGFYRSNDKQKKLWEKINTRYWVPLDI